MEGKESAFKTLRNAEIDYNKNQIADPAVAREMADVEKDFHKKKMGFVKPSEERLAEGREAAFDMGVEVLAQEAQKIVSDIHNLEIQERERKFNGELISFEYGGHAYKLDHFPSYMQDDVSVPDYFLLVSVDGNTEFTDEEEQRIIQKFEIALRMKLDDMKK
ncbi:MAG: hypothetical protein WC819_02920 [Parcubacteria group bacterium]|jgi:hypothetical protein